MMTDMPLLSFPQWRPFLSYPHSPYPNIMKIHEWMTNGITSFFTKLATGVEILCLHSTPKLEEVNLEHLMQSHIPVVSLYWSLVSFSIC